MATLQSSRHAALETSLATYLGLYALCDRASGLILRYWFAIKEPKSFYRGRSGSSV